LDFEEGENPMRRFGLRDQGGVLAMLLAGKLNVEDKIMTLWSGSAGQCGYTFADALGF
jgi:hypothetical protein